MRQFQDIKRGTRTVLEYLNEIKSVSDQLAAIGHPVSDKDKVQQALSGLGTEFDIFCTTLEVLPILPSFEDLKAKLFQHEASRVQRQNLIPSNSHNVLITGTHAMQGHRTRPWTPQAGMGRAGETRTSKDSYRSNREDVGRSWVQQRQRDRGAGQRQRDVAQIRRRAEVQAEPNREIEASGGGRDVAQRHRRREEMQAEPDRGAGVGREQCCSEQWRRVRLQARSSSVNSDEQCRVNSGVG
ncbi:hypothetical protein EJ110_NYTH59530 [Nymphaea thermarum]|nr:hypothetical protein EJ110_NYTH59530 [Nymphaea thermarum]